jgi:hypothetical protein
MRTLITVGFIVVGGAHIWAADSDLFPLQGLEVGMTATDLLKAYPNVKTAFAKKDAKGQLTDGLVLCDIANGVHWDGALIHVRDSRVQSWGYARTKDFDRAAKQVAVIYKALVQTLGDKPEKMVAFHLVRQGKVRSPMFVWKLGDAIVAFTHSPVKNHKSGEPFICQLTIAPNVEVLHGLLDLAQDRKVNDHELFQEVTDRSGRTDK